MVPGALRNVIVEVTIAGVVHTPLDGVSSAHAQNDLASFDNLEKPVNDTFDVLALRLASRSPVSRHERGHVAMMCVRSAMLTDPSGAPFDRGGARRPPRWVLAAPLSSRGQSNVLQLSSEHPTDESGKVVIGLQRRVRQPSRRYPS